MVSILTKKIIRLSSTKHFKSPSRICLSCLWYKLDSEASLIADPGRPLQIQLHQFAHFTHLPNCHDISINDILNLWDIIYNWMHHVYLFGLGGAMKPGEEKCDGGVSSLWLCPGLIISYHTFW